MIPRVHPLANQLTLQQVYDGSNADQRALPLGMSVVADGAVRGFGLQIVEDEHGQTETYVLDDSAGGTEK